MRSLTACSGSSHTASGSTSTCATPAPSHAVAILLVSGAPTRTTSSETCSSAKPGARSNASYAEIAFGPSRNPEMGSASTGHPADSAKRIAVAAETRAPQPATSNRRGCERTSWSKPVFDIA